MPSSVKVSDSAMQFKAKPIDLVNKDVMLKTTTLPKKAFINQQILYTIKLYHSQRLMDAEYHPPQVEDALMMPVGDSHSSEVVIDGRNYLVEEQKYAIFPQKTGTLKINPPSFTALVFTGVPHRITVRAKSTNLTIKTTPPHTAKYWLPSQQVALTQTYDVSTERMIEGSTIVRKITLQASGVPAQLLPPLEFSNSKNFNDYPEKPELNNSINQNGVVGREDLTVTYILNQPGVITLPGLQVKWFNIDTGKEEFATLPSRTITVMPKVKKEKIIPPTKQSKAVAHEISKTQHGTLRLLVGQIGWVVAAFFILLWLLTIYWLKKPNKENSKAILKKVKGACIHNQAQVCEKALLAWARTYYHGQNIFNLNQIVNLVKYTPLQQELIQLSTYLYEPQPHKTWDGGAKLWQAMQEFMQQKKSKINSKQDLPPINP